MAPKRGKKRASDVQEVSAKSQKKESTDANEASHGANGSSSKARKTIEKLLSDDIQRLAFPKILPGQGEIDWPASKGKKAPPEKGAGKTEDDDSKKKGTRNYTSPDLSPFEQLVCAILLSKPIGHKLGLRSIQTILSPPFSMTTPKAMVDAGNEGRRAALWEARTQHKEKTAAQLGDLIEGLKSLTDDEEEQMSSELIAVRNKASNAKSHAEAVKTVQELLCSNIKGLGPTGVDIFLRQVQRQPGWESVFPFIDARARKTAVQFKLFDDNLDTEEGARELAELVQGDAVKMVKLLDVLIGVDLEKKTEEVLRQV